MFIVAFNHLIVNLTLPKKQNMFSFRKKPGFLSGFKRKSIWYVFISALCYVHSFSFRKEISGPTWQNALDNINYSLNASYWAASVSEPEINTIVGNAPDIAVQIENEVGLGLISWRVSMASQRCLHIKYQ